MKKLTITLTVLLLSLSGCGIVKGIGEATGHVMAGVGHGLVSIGEGVSQDLSSASTGHAKEYTKNYTK